MSTWTAEIKKHINTTWIKSCKIDIEGLKSILKPECVTCNLKQWETLAQRNECAVGEKCPFTYNSPQEGAAARAARGKDPQESRRGVSTYLAEFGFNKKLISNYGKAQIYMFIYYPNLGFGYPPTPPFDIFGTFNRNQIEKEMLIDSDKLKQMRCAIHHINRDKYDDRKINIALVLSTEHTKIEHMTVLKAKHALNAIAHRNLCLFGDTFCPTFSNDQLNSNDFDRIIRG